MIAEKTSVANAGTEDVRTAMMDAGVVVKERKTRKPRARTRYIVLRMLPVAEGEAFKRMAEVIFDGSSKSEKTAWAAALEWDLAEGTHDFIMASVRGQKTVMLERKLVFTVK